MARKQRKYILTETAEIDFRHAKKWSQSRWGKELTTEYFSDIHKTAENISANYLGSSKKEGAAEISLNVYPVREHYLVYLPVKKDLIIITALIRQTRDVPAIIKANNFIIRRQLKNIFNKINEKKLFS